MTTDVSRTADAPLIDARALVKHYGDTKAVRALSFTVRRGEVVGFLGPNGAGKSTTMKMLTGYLRPTSGSATILGYDVAVDGLLARKKLGYLPENAPLYDEMMVIDFLRFVADVRGVAPSACRARLRDVAERCGLMDVLGKDIGALSKGFRQRVGLAQALVHEPDLLILDEPTSGLDPNQIVEIRALIRDLGRDKTVLLSTHILSEVRAVCSRAIIIAGGAIVADDTPQALEQRGGLSQVQLTLTGRAGNDLDVEKAQRALRQLPGVREVQLQQSEAPQQMRCTLQASGSNDVRAALFELAVAQNWCVLELHRVQASLEETFQRLTAGAAGSDNKESSRHAA